MSVTADRFQATAAEAQRFLDAVEASGLPAPDGVKLSTGMATQFCWFWGRLTAHLVGDASEGLTACLWEDWDGHAVQAPAVEDLLRKVAS